MSGPVEVRITEFRDLARVAEAVGAGSEVVIRFDEANAELRRRIVDFSSGLAFGRATLTKPSDHEYVLSPN